MDYYYFILYITIFFTICILHVVKGSNECDFLPSNSICFGVLAGQGVSPPLIRPSNESCIIESKFVTPSIWSSLNEPCRSTFARYQCSLVYPPCLLNVPLASSSNNSSSSSGPAPCKEWCEELISTCSLNLSDLQLIQSLVPTACSALPSAYTYNGTSNNSNNNTNLCVNKPQGLIPPINPVIPLNTCGEYNGSVCAGIIHYPISLTQFNQQEQLASSLTFLFPLMPKSMETTCHVQLALYMCMTLFPKCVQATIINPYTMDNPNKISITVPAPMSNNQCVMYTSTCLPFIFTFHTKLITSGLLAKGDIRTETVDNFLRPPCSTNTKPLTTSPFTQTCGGTNLVPVVGDSLSSVPGMNYFPMGYSNVTVSIGLANPVILSIPNDDQTNRDITTIQMPIICPKPLVATEYGELTLPNRNSYCAVTCPAPYFSRSDWLGIDQIIWICSIASLGCSTIMLSTWLIFPAKRAQTLVLCFILCCFGVSSSLFFSYVSVYPDIDTVGCTHQVKGWSYDDVGSGRCVASGFFTVFFFSSMTCWWLLIGLDLFIHLIAFSLSSYQKKIQMILFHLYGWGLPLVLCSIGLATKSFGGKVFWPICFFSDAAPSWADWTIFYVPLAFNFTFGMIFLLLVLRAICISTSQRRRLKPSVLSNSTNIFTDLYYYIRDSPFFTVMGPHFRLIVFLAQFAFLFAVLFCVRLHLYLMENDIKAEVLSWITCLFLGGTNTDNSCGSTPVLTIGISEFYLIAIASAAQGAINFLAYGTQVQNYRLWLQLFSGKGTVLRSSSNRTDKTPNKGGTGSSDSTPGQRPRRIIDHTTDVGRKSESQGRPPRSSMALEVSQSQPLSEIDLTHNIHRHSSSPIFPIVPYSSSVNTKQIQGSPILDPLSRISPFNNNNTNSSGPATPIELDSPYTPSEDQGSKHMINQLYSNDESSVNKSFVKHTAQRLSPQLNLMARRPVGPFPVKRRTSLPQLTTILSERATERGFDFQVNPNKSNTNSVSRKEENQNGPAAGTPSSKSKVHNKQDESLTININNDEDKTVTTNEMQNTHTNKKDSVDISINPLVNQNLESIMEPHQST